MMNNQRLFNIGGGGDSPPAPANNQGQQQPQLQGTNPSGQGLGRLIPLPKSSFKIVQRSSPQQQQQQQQQIEEAHLQGQQRILHRTVANGNGQPQRLIIQGQASGNPRRIQNYGRSKSLSQSSHPAQFQQQQGVPALQFRKSINSNNPGVGMRKLQPPQLIRATIPSPASANHSSPSLGTSSSPAMSNASSATPSSTPGSAVINANPPKPKRLKSIQMRLRCRASALPLHTTYFEDNMVVEKDADVVFICGDGGRVRGHKIILASLSKLFTDIFMDQPLGEVSYVSMPDIRSDTMKLIILLGYKPDIYITKEQIDLLKDQFDILRINFEGMTIDEADSVTNLDVEPGKVVENIDVNKKYQFEKNKRPQSPLKHHGQGQKLSYGFVPNRGGTFDQNGPYHHQKYNGESDDETFKIQGYPTENHFEHRKSGLKPRPDLPDDDDEEYRDAPAVASSASSDQDSIKEWMENVGKTAEQAKYRCSTCKTGFENEEIYKWHEARHYAECVYRCTICDTIKVSARAIWNHEESVHQFVGIPLTEVDEAEANSQRLNLLRLAQIRKAKAAKFGSRPELKLTSKPFPQTNHAIKIGHGELTDGSLNWSGMDSKKVKQLHWLYVCARCDNCAGSTGSAFGHYKKCYDELEAKPTFENTITKYRQGFYGKFSCPLCPRKYLGNGGVTIHCGHQHTEYRKMFTYTGAHEDKLKCNHCHRKYSSPEDFHRHLQNGTQCIQDPINENSMPQLTKNSSSTATERKKKVVEEKESKKEEKEKIAKPLPPPPRSARLAKRASALLMAKVLSEKDESDEDKTATKTTTTKRRSVALDYPPAECPICGSEVDNISQHLATEHSDLNVNVNRVSTDLLRCRKCLLTFAICDLLSHSSTCGKNKPTHSGEESETSSSDATETEKPKKEKVIKAPAEPLPIPPGVGCSPIDSMDLTLEELTNKEVLTNFFICSVCGYKGAKMGAISRCLQTHGIVRCSLCFNTYLNRQDYEAHLAKLHQIGTKFLCPFTANGTCTAKAYSNIGQLVGHLQNCHWDMQFKNRMKKGEKGGKSSTKGAAMNKTMGEIDGTEEMDEETKPVEAEATISTTTSDDNATEKTSNDDHVPEIDKIEHETLPTIFKNKEETIEDTESSKVENGSKKETDENKTSSTEEQIMSDNDNKTVNDENREIKADATEDTKDSVPTTESEEIESTQIEDDKMDTTT